MEETSHQEPNNRDQPPKKNHFSSGAEDIWAWWNERATFKEGDTWSAKIKKIGIRFIGVILLVVFSPVLLFALIVSFIVAL